MRVIIHLECTQCRERNYSSHKNKKNNPERLEMKKYCPRCKGHTLHKETK
ncbi:MAG: 50S ribosomal protein L33 [Firmicutes bacterium]|nr:50S ribosomal protein L33 [Bacillota bacterium]